MRVRHHLQQISSCESKFFCTGDTRLATCPSICTLCIIEAPAGRYGSLQAQRIRTVPSVLHAVSRVSSIDKRLPYELRALEAGLSCALRLLEGEVASLEAATQPRLERLLGKVCVTWILSFQVGKHHLHTGCQASQGLRQSLSQASGLCWKRSSGIQAFPYLGRCIATGPNQQILLPHCGRLWALAKPSLSQSVMHSAFLPIWTTASYHSKWVSCMVPFTWLAHVCQADPAAVFQGMGPQRPRSLWEG